MWRVRRILAHRRAGRNSSACRHRRTSSHRRTCCNSCTSSHRGASRNGCATQRPPPPPAREADSAAFPITIEHKFGSTEITEIPKRIVTVGLTDQDALLALGVVPVGTTEWFGEHPSAVWPWAQDLLGGAKPEVVGDATAVNYEKIVALKPDVILALYSGVTEDAV